MTQVATDSAAFSTLSAPIREVWSYMQTIILLDDRMQEVMQYF